jgi:putative membrane protein
MTSLANLPNFLMYFGASIVLLAAFLGAYTLVTPLHEWALIREGNAAVALSLAGATLGFTLPLASAIVHSVDLADMAIWAAVALILQLVCFASMRLLRRDVSAALARGDMAEATVLATGSVVFGLLIAACLS